MQSIHKFRLMRFDSGRVVKDCGRICPPGRWFSLTSIYVGWVVSVPQMFARSGLGGTPSGCGGSRKCGRLLPQTIPHPIAMRLRKGGAPGVGGGSCDGRGAKFGLLGSISTEEGCVAAGGTFQPNLFGVDGACVSVRDG